MRKLAGTLIASTAVSCVDLDVRRGAERAILKGLSVEVPQGQRVAIMGPSGSGKSTLLSTLCGLLQPTRGVVRIGDIDIFGLPERERTRWRLMNIGYVSQFGGLIDELTVTENIELPIRLGRTPDHIHHAAELIEQLGLTDCAHNRADELSGGQIQRTAIARALIGRPALVLADEPTGSLDEDASDEVGRLLTATATSASTTLIIATHDASLAERADGIFVLRRGALVQC